MLIGMKLTRWMPGAGFVAALALLAPASAGAALITPTTTADEYNSNPGACSLREAIESANTDSVVNADGCTQGSGSDQIDLEARVYKLTIPSANGGGGLNSEGDLDISGGNLEVNGPDLGRAVIDGNGTVTGHRAIEIPNLAPAILVRFHKVEIIGGGAASPTDSGGGIAVNGIAFAHDLLITRSTITGNRGINGGGIDVQGQSQLTLRNTTVSGNDATVDGGGIHHDAGGTVLSNVTIAGNRANSDGDFIGDGGGVVSDGGDFHLDNTILAGNLDVGQDLNDAPDCEGTATVESSGFSLIGNTANCPYVAGPGDLTGADPKLGPLGNNGGTSRTLALLPESPAIDHGSTDTGPTGSPCENEDQRDLDRSLGGRCDIGAYERVTCAGVAVNRIGTEGNDALLGTAGADGFLLFAGNDLAKGKAGGDAACGSAGNDKLLGQKGKDRLLGQAGRDRLIGGAKRDRLFGGKGRDVLIGGKGKDRCKGGPGRDRLKTC
jgi:CSLREA domain-containing protein